MFSVSMQLPFIDKKSWNRFVAVDVVMFVYKGFIGSDDFNAQNTYQESSPTQTIVLRNSFLAQGKIYN